MLSPVLQTHSQGVYSQISQICSFRHLILLLSKSISSYDPVGDEELSITFLFKSNLICSFTSSFTCVCIAFSVHCLLATSSLLQVVPLCCLILLMKMHMMLHYVYYSPYSVGFQFQSLLPEVC
ncbi:uncharacterized protein LOC132624992 isoform X2 [Lycium barbarum]|uniref:uncharacterized protein LOC132624992 isoform X2 n=1 Tax=Lycium barbarum TaxID=112863 RepID=UPI00293E0C35|nr:uncharacterized protein LOC132624992 isoform X2 [Lycium barbarum]